MKYDLFPIRQATLNCINLSWQPTTGRLNKELNLFDNKRTRPEDQDRGRRGPDMVRNKRF